MTARPRTTLAVLSVCAAANLTVAVVFLFTKPERWSDVIGVSTWCRAWLLHGAHLYADPDLLPDYPPNAIVTFAPLGWLPRPSIVPLSAALSGLLLPILPLMVVRATPSRARVPAGFVILCFLCWGAVRALLQFSLLSMTCAFIAVRLADSRPTAGGVWLGLALAKPHVAAPIALWAALTRRWRIVLVSAATFAVAFAAYCLRAHAAPLETIVDYWRILGEDYAGPGGLTGITSIRAWMSDGAWLAAAALLLAVPAAMTVARPRLARGRGRLAIAGAFGAWSLLAFYHNAHNLILLLPVFVFLLAVDDPRTRRERIAAAAALQLAMMIDAPLRRAGLTGVDRFVALAAFGYLPLLWWRIGEYDTSREC